MSSYSTRLLSSAKQEQNPSYPEPKIRFRSITCDTQSRSEDLKPLLISAHLNSQFPVISNFYNDVFQGRISS